MGVDKSVLLNNVRWIFKNGWSSVRLNFNIGLPNETYEDIDEIFNLAQEIVDIYSQSRAKEKLSLTVKLNCYIPSLYEKKKYNINTV